MTTMTLDERDLAFFEDVKDLLANKYPDLKDKFGIWRNHQHFDLKEDEVFHETSNYDSKESTMRIIKAKDLPANAFISSWKLDNEGPVAATWCCDYKPVP